MCNSDVNWECYDRSTIANTFINIYSMQSSVDLAERDVEKVVKYYVSTANFVVLDE